MSEFVIVLMTASSQQEAERIAKSLVTEWLAACVNVIPNAVSFYRWEGKVQRDQEVLLIAKSRKDVLEDLIRRVRSLHSYTVPEIIALPLSGGSDDYLRWVDQEVHGGWHAMD